MSDLITDMIDSLRKRAAKEVGSVSEAKLREEYLKGLDKAEALLPKAQYEAGDKLAAPVYLMGSQALKIMRSKEAEFGKLGLAGATVVVAELTSGNLDQAAVDFLITKAGWSDLFKAMAGARDADAQQERNKRQAIEETKTFLKEVGQNALVHGLPFLLKAITAAAL